MYRVLTALIIALSLALPATGASLLPDGMQTFVDSNGVPLAGGQVCLYVPGTSTPKLTWQNRQQTVANTSPCVTLNSAGQAILWGYGQYRQILYDLNGNVKWDQLVADYVSDQQNNAFNWAGTSAGSANAQTISVQPQLMAYSAGQLFAFLAGFTNSGPATLNVNGLGARNLFKLTSAGAVPLTGAEISAGGVVFTVYDGSEFQIVSTSLPAGPTILVPQITNNVATHGASYTVQNGDDHSTIVLTGSTGGQTLIVNSHSSYSDGSFSFQVCNASTRRWSVTTADGGTVFSFPKQCYLVMNNGSGLVPSAQQRYYVPSPQLYVSTSSCSDSNNDGLAAGSPLCTVGHAITVLQTLFDTAGTVSYLQLADGTYTEQINFSGNVPGGGDLIRINGNNSNPTNVKLHAPSGAGNSAVMVRDFGTLQISNAELACPSSGGGTAVNASQFATVDLINVTVGSCDGSNALAAVDSGHINIENGLTVSGNAGTEFYIVGSGSLIAMGGSQTITCGAGGGWNFSVAFMEATNGGNFSTEGTTLNTSGCGSTTGAQYLVANNAVATTGGSTLPGGTGGTTATGGIYQ